MVDQNDLDRYGMDAITQRRLRVKKAPIKKIANKPKKPLRTSMPFSLKFNESLKSKLRSRGWKSEPEKVKPEKYVFDLFFKSHPALKRYNLEIKQGNKRIVARGRIKGRRIVDYELEVWTESKASGGDVIVKFNLFQGDDNPIGETYRVNIVRAVKVAPKFANKFDEFLSELRRR